MRLILTVLCRDEEDIIEAFCKFHLDKGVDHIIATDNKSVDRTRTILQKFENKGLLTIIDEPEHNHDQAIWVSRMAKIADEQLKADWIINSDADEFWWPKSGNFKKEFRKTNQETNALKVKRTNFLPPDHQISTETPFWKSMIIREKSSLNSLGSPLPPKVCHRAISDAFIEDGNHTVKSASTPIITEATESIEILHYPIRSYWQFERKIRQGAEALHTNKRVSKNIGSTWKHLYEEHLKKHSLFEHYCNLRPGNDIVESKIRSNELVEDKRILQHMSGHVKEMALNRFRRFIAK